MTHDDEDHDSSLIAAFIYPDGKEGWAAGGHLSATSFEGRYCHTQDGGKTWVKEAIPGE